MEKYTEAVTAIAIVYASVLALLVHNIAYALKGGASSWDIGFATIVLIIMSMIKVFRFFAKERPFELSSRLPEIN